MAFDYSTVAFCDTETLGLDPDRHPVWEIAIIVDDEQYVWQQWVEKRYLDRGDPVGLEKNGFRRRYRQETALHPWDSANRFGELLAGRHIVGAAPWFDAERLHKVWRDTRLFRHESREHPWHHRHYDIGSMALGRFGEPIGGLKDVADMIGVEYDETKLHSALYDCLVAKQCFERMVG